MQVHTVGNHYLAHGDCIEVMRLLPDASIDACVTDPPYGLGFMGKAWDGMVPGVDFARELLRVLKPGAHACLFGGTRTYHRLAVALEDAGFEIRDCLSWLYGTGFPKSLDVSKAIDQARVEDEETVRAVCRAVRAAMGRAGLTSKIIADRLGYHSRLIDHFAARDTDSQPAIASSERWAELVEIMPELETMSPEVARLNARKGDYGEAWKAAPVIGEHVGKVAGLAGERFRVSDPTIREPSEGARQWEGWGTALKPSWEPCLLVRKPLAGTVAANVQAHGTGGLNIDACRIEGVKPDTTRGESRRGRALEGGPLRAQGRIEDDGKGRWPANVVLDEVAAAMLDEQAGNTSRFFYVAKPSRAERDLGCAHLPARTGGEATDRKDGAPGTLNPRAGACGRGGARNIHPTVKPAALIRWLLQLVTPPGGVVLDPFCGSGTIFVAAKGLDLSVAAIEREDDYLPIALARGRASV